MEYFLPRMLRILSLYFLGLLQAYIMGQTIWNISYLLILVKHFSISKFYETTPIITNKKWHQKWTLLGHSKKTLTY